MLELRIKCTRVGEYFIIAVHPATSSEDWLKRIKNIKKETKFWW
jgi:hypothetical protein